MVGALLDNVNVKRLTYAIVAVFAFIFVTDYLIHQLWLGEIYRAMPSHWRQPEEMKQYFLFLLLGQFIIAKYFTIIFAKGYEGKGPAEGLRFGFLMAFFTIGGLLIQYAVTPVPTSLVLKWALGYLMQSLGAGVVAALVYRR